MECTVKGCYEKFPDFESCKQHIEIAHRSQTGVLRCLAKRMSDKCPLPQVAD